MKPTRTLALKKETLVELSTTELHEIAGGYELTPQCPTNYCVSMRLHCYISDIMDPCLTR